MGAPILRLEADDIVVLLLGAPDVSRAMQGRVEGVTRLEKLVFLLERETSVGSLLAEDLEFHPHNYGPFSIKIYQAVETLAAAGLIADSAAPATSSEDMWETHEVIGSDPSDTYATRNFMLTGRGKQYYKALLKNLPEPLERELQQFKSRFATLPLQQLIRYVYTRYDRYIGKSLIKDRILGTE